MQFLEVLGPFPFSFVSFFLNECNVMPTSEKFSILLTFTFSHSKIIPFLSCNHLSQPNGGNCLDFKDGITRIS